MEDLRDMVEIKGKMIETLVSIFNTTHINSIYSTYCISRFKYFILKQNFINLTITEY